MPERVALPSPVLQDPVEGVLLEQDADARVLLVQVAALEQPAIDLLARFRARLHDRAAGFVRMFLKVGDEPELQRMDTRNVAPVLQRKAAGPILAPQVPELVVIDRGRRQVTREKGAEIG